MLTMLHRVTPLLQVGSKLGELLPSLMMGTSISHTFNVGASGSGGGDLRDALTLVAFAVPR